MLGAVTHGELVVNVEETVDDKGVLGLHVAESRVLTLEEEATVSDEDKVIYGALDMLSMPPATMMPRWPRAIA